MNPKSPTDQKHSNCHHVYPKSRFPMPYRAGKRKLLENWIILPAVSIVSHNALHAIFGNRTPEEQLEFLREICENNILNINIYADYKDLFDKLFNGNILFDSMAGVLKKWDLSDHDKQKYADKIKLLLKVLNNNIRGGIPVKKYL